MRPRTMIIVGITAVVAGVAAYGISEFNRTPKNAADLEETACISADALLAAFLTDEAAANTRFVGTTDQAVCVTGAVRSLDTVAGKVNVVLETTSELSGVVCEFDPRSVPTAWKIGTAVQVKGICQGYSGDGMLPGDVILQRCTALE